MSQIAVSSPNAANRAGSLARRFLANTGPLIVLLLMIVILYIASPPFRTPTSMLLIGLEAASLGLVAAGQTFVILTGGIDLSVEAMVSFSGVVAAVLIAGTNVAGGQIAHGIASWEAIPIALLAALAIGLLMGVFITQLKMNPFIVTLGFRSMLLGVCLVWTHGAGINIQKDGYTGSRPRDRRTRDRRACSDYRRTCATAGRGSGSWRRCGHLRRLRSPGPDQPVPRGHGRGHEAAHRRAQVEARSAGAGQRM
jgi:hypothetical protein